MAGRMVPGLLAGLVAGLVGAVLVLASPAEAADGWETDQVADATSRYGVVVDAGADGEAVAMWVEGSGSDGVLYGARRPAGGPWESPVELGEGYHFAPGSVALLASGAAYFEYTDAGLEGDVLARWGLDDSVTTTDVGGRAESIRLWSDPVDDDVVVSDVSQLRGPAQRTRLHLATDLTPDGSWTSTVGVNTFAPEVAFGPGHDYAVGYATPRGVLRVDRVDAATGATPTLVRDAPCDRAGAAGVALALDDVGRGAVAWRCPGDRGSIRAAYLRVDGAGRTEVLDRSRAGVDDRLVGPVLAAAPGGRVVALWGVQRQASHAVVASGRGARDDWSPREQAAGGQQSLVGFTAAAATTGAAVVAWTDGGTVRALVREPGDALLLTEVVSGPSWSGPRPSVGADGTAWLTVGLEGADDLVVVHRRPPPL